MLKVKYLKYLFAAATAKPLTKRHSFVVLKNKRLVQTLQLSA